ncbi:MAG TPA: wax ester/triacylglycerol synthase family O-acyltransferase [Actinomycetes bacterium]|nr:wax ester/triacylglycerol synthase family O-acyltransferase [Actinomycetes bacterium]
MDRLTAQDLMMLWPEEMGWSQDIGALAILDGRPLLDADGRFRIEAARKQIGRRLHLVPRFRQLLYQPPYGLGWPLWVDARSVDLAEHVRVCPLAAPADEAQLLLACEELRHRRLDQSRPLWELWFLPGLPDKRVGLFMKVHHAIADGVAGMVAFGAFLDLVPEPPEISAPPPWTPAAMPSRRALFEDNVRRHLEALGRVPRMLAHPVETVRQARRGWPAVHEAFLEARAPRTSLNRRIGSHRSFALVRSDLELVKRIAHSNNAKVNDVLMVVVAGGLRELLVGRGERVNGLVLRAFVPVSLHTELSDQARGNLDGAMMVPLPIGEPDEVRRLRLIADETAKRKQKRRPPGGTLFRSVPIQRATLRLAPYQRVMSTYAANIPGPPVPLYFAGAPLLEVFPVVPIMANVSIGAGALSYAGQFNITAVADRELCPDIEIFAEGARRSLDALAASLAVHSRPGEA